MIRSACLGFNRTGENMELPVALKKYLNKEIMEPSLQQTALAIKKSNWLLQQKNEVDIICSNDFSLYDNVLDMTCLLGNIQRRYYWEGGKVPLEIYFSMARGQQKEKFDVLPLELEYYFNTNYMYFVPEFVDPIDFAYSDNKPVLEYLESKATLQKSTRPVILGPITYLMLGKSKESDIAPLDLLEELMAVYADLFINFARIGVDRVQMDEHFLTTELSREAQSAYVSCYKKMRDFAKNIKIDLTASYGSVRNNIDIALSLPVDSFHFDIHNDIDYIDEYLVKVANHEVDISLGVVNANNVWKNQILKSINTVEKFCNKIGTERIIIAPTSSLFLCPYSVEKEKNLLPELKKQFSFAKEKLSEVNLIKKAINQGYSSVKEEVEKCSTKVFEFFKNRDLQSEVDIFFEQNPFNEKVKKNDKRKQFDYKQRKDSFNKKFNIPAIASTIIGFMPDSADSIDSAKKSIKDSVDIQEKVSIDIITSGDGEKASCDNATFFAKNLDGFYILKNNAIPRFGHDYYNPVIIVSDIRWTKSVTKDYVTYLKSVTKKNYKYSITGPVSLVNNAFLPEAVDIIDLYKQATYAMYKEFESIANLVNIVQIDEYLMFNNMPIKANYTAQYINQICQLIESVYSNNCEDKKIILHVGYSNMKDTVEYLCRMNVDVLFIESARSGHEILSSFISYKPPMDIGLGVFDSKDCRQPTKQEMFVAAKKMIAFFDESQIWIIPDSSFNLKKDNKEVSKILTTLVSTTKEIRTYVKESEKY
jgi:5-methyltetrahydropteroyltriglutamate--homocysteine methyltransferase